MITGEQLARTPWTQRVDRRDFLRGAGVALAAVAPGSSLLSACGDGSDPDGRPGRRGPADFEARYADATRRAEAHGPPARELRLVAEPGEVRAGPDGRWRTWHYSGQYPGPEIRVTEGERLRVTVENRLPDPTTVHWHGVPVPNAMDGVPGVTQPAIPPGETFVYDYVAEPAGTYVYHSHVGLQLDRGLVGGADAARLLRPRTHAGAGRLAPGRADPRRRPGRRGNGRDDGPDAWDDGWRERRGAWRP